MKSREEDGFGWMAEGNERRKERQERRREEKRREEKKRREGRRRRKEKAETWAFVSATDSKTALAHAR